jgi:hypothetical protein
VTGEYGQRATEERTGKDLSEKERFERVGDRYKVRREREGLDVG